MSERLRKLFSSLHAQDVLLSIPVMSVHSQTDIYKRASSSRARTLGSYGNVVRILRKLEQQQLVLLRRVPKIRRTNVMLTRRGERFQGILRTYLDALKGMGR